MNIAGVVVLYNPDNKVFENINTYLPFLEKLFVVDNSNKYNEELINELKNIEKVVYISLNGNQGIAKALNQGAESAINKGFSWCLTMDQDSCFDVQGIDTLIKSLHKIENLDKTAIIASSYSNEENKQPKGDLFDYQERFCVITSGNLLNLAIYQKLGGFLEKLFIDQVDHEYCLRAKKHRYKIIQLKNVYLNHSLGKVLKLDPKAFLGHRSGYISLHSPIRVYYQTRNQWYVWNQYFLRFPLYMAKDMYKEHVRLLRNLVYNEGHRLKIATSIIKGTFHFLIGKMGS